MEFRALLAVLLLGAITFAGCTGNFSFGDVANRTMCQDQLSACSEKCNGYLLGSDVEACKANCNNQYAACLK